MDTGGWSAVPYAALVAVILNLTLVQYERGSRLAADWARLGGFTNKARD